MASESVLDRHLLLRARIAYSEMPGLCLTASQARRLWNLEAGTCNTLLEALIREGFLGRTEDGLYVHRSRVRRSIQATEADARPPRADDEQRTGTEAPDPRIGA